LVGSDTGGQPVKLTLVRAGDVSTLDVTLGKHQAPEPWVAQPGLVPLPFSEHHHPAFGESSADASSEANWQGFDLLSLDKLNDDKYKAVIAYLADNGSHKRLEFTGTRHEIRQKILAQKDLPERERNQLLAVLTSRDGLFPARAYAWPYSHYEQDFPLPPPWWGWYPAL
jgi:hypothetical protein